MTGQHGEAAGVAPHLCVLLLADFHPLQAASIGALTGDDIRDRRERMVELARLLVDRAEERLVAGSANLALVVVLMLQGCILSSSSLPGQPEASRATPAKERDDGTGAARGGETLLAAPTVAAIRPHRPMRRRTDLASDGTSKRARLRAEGAAHAEQLLARLRRRPRARPREPPFGVRSPTRVE